MLGHPSMPMAMKTFWKPFPSTAIRAIANNMYGKAKKTSAVRMMMLSQKPP